MNARSFRMVGGLILAVVALGLMASSAIAREISAFPAPHTRVASKSTTLSFRGLKPGELKKLVVIGSKTGRHRGKLRKHTGGHGVSFIPNKEFAINEVVRVKTNLDVRLGNGHGYWFKIGNFRTKAKKAPTGIPQEGEIPPDAVTFRTRPNFKVPRVTIDTPAAAGTAPGYVFMAPKADGPMILDNEGNLIWYRKAETADFRVQRWKGQPVLTWWQGPFRSNGVTQGTYLLLNRRYEVIKRVRAGNGYSGDLHSFKLTNRGTALLSTYKAVKKDLRPYGGPQNGTVLDSIAQEVDLRTNLVIWEWHSLGNIPLSDSMVPAPETPEGAWDYFHINSISSDSDGNLIVSGRNTSAAYRISRKNGKVLWRLGGKRSSFKKVGEGTNTAWQHDAERQSNGEISIFDNGAAPPLHKVSRALFLRLGKNRTVEVVRQYTHPKKLLANSQGNVQLLPNGNVFVGWGSEPYFTEFAPGGEVLFDAHFAAHNSSYRSFRFPWEGRPSEPPAIASEAQPGGTVKAWASWNGDTRVATWQLLAGPSADALAVVGSAPRDGFETEVTATSAGPFVAMQGLDANGAVLGTTVVTQIGEQAK
ncbi:MAG: arylsulfotransferase family protein [Solirubrobacterales bacterium]